MVQMTVGMENLIFRLFCMWILTLWSSQTTIKTLVVFLFIHLNHTACSQIIYIIKCCSDITLKLFLSQFLLKHNLHTLRCTNFKCRTDMEHFLRYKEKTARYKRLHTVCLLLCKEGKTWIYLFAYVCKMKHRKGKSG